MDDTEISQGPRKDDTYNARFFRSVEKEDAFILRQIDLVHEPPITYYTEAQWIALKLSISEEKAQQKIERAQASKRAGGTEENT